MCKVIQLSRVLGISYISSNNQHVRNEKIYAITKHDGIQLQVEKHNKAKKQICICAICYPFPFFEVKETHH